MIVTIAKVIFYIFVNVKTIDEEKEKMNKHKKDEGENTIFEQLKSSPLEKKTMIRSEHVD